MNKANDAEQVTKAIGKARDIECLAAVVGALNNPERRHQYLDAVILRGVELIAQHIEWLAVDVVESLDPHGIPGTAPPKETRKAVPAASSA